MRRSLFYLLFFCINIILMKVMLLGAGAVGAPLCTRLTKASELYLIMDDKRAEEYKGIIVNGLHYQIPLAKKGDKADLIILLMVLSSISDSNKSPVNFNFISSL